MSVPIAIDTSVAVPLLVRSHAAHEAVVRWWSGRPIALAGHASVETYAVLTRLPGDLRLTPADAARLMAARFGHVMLLGPDALAQVPTTLGHLGIAGGATYDAIVALAALQHDVPLATRDARARSTYERVGVRVEVAGDAG
ncbi:MAG: type II toxin-antitoxin system VapC family toxin [Nocardiopsis sp. BM-2018]|nr:MAG: type II toxin-antitoxin system VapC family toxin [Nocardiopsis sp. BM-2018]